MPKVSRVLVGIVVVAAAGLSLFLGSAATRGLTHDDDAIGRIVSIGGDQNKAMKHLDRLVNDIGPRPVGSSSFVRTCKWARDEFKRFGLENVHLEEVEWNETVVYNVVADITGTAFPDEYVIVGAHSDTAPAIDGATDDGAGVAAVMEAARILAVSDARPRRTVRFIIFGGEEVGLVGSKGYLGSHPDIIPKVSAVYVMDQGANFISGISATAPLAADMREVFARAMTLDSKKPFEVRDVEYLPAADPNCCASKIALAGASAKVNEGASCGNRLMAQQKSKPALGCGARADAGEGCGAPAAPAEGEGFVVKRVTAAGETLMARVVIPGAPGGGKDLKLDDYDLEALGITPEMLKARGDSVKMLVAVGSSDHAPFLAAGIPAFLWKQDAGDSAPYPFHTREDTYDKVIAEHLEHSAVVIALGAFETANLDHMLSREKLIAPEGAASTGAAGAEKTINSPCGGAQVKESMRK